MPQLLFVNGFHRSGTTVVTAAVTEALGGVTTTVGVLARHIPTLGEFLEQLVPGTADRGADRLEITAQTAEEYGFLLSHRTGTQALYGHPAGLEVLREHVAELTADAPDATIVLKNPWETGRERQLLADFPGARIIILRRRLADIERSIGVALVRAGPSRYFRALEGDSKRHRNVERLLASRFKRRLLLRALRLVVRARAYRLAGSVRQLPAERIALLSYDELRADPQVGAAWAGHVADPRAFAEAFVEHAFAEQSAPAPSSIVQRAVDRRWRRAWDDMRAQQVRAGILTPAAGAERAATAAVAP